MVNIKHRQKHQLRKYQRHLHFCGFTLLQFSCLLILMGIKLHVGSVAGECGQSRFSSALKGIDQ